MSDKSQLDEIRRREAELKWAADRIERGNPLFRRAEAGNSQVTLAETDKRRSPEGVLWKVEPYG